jgi:ATP-binding cassette subfamily B protein
MSADDPARSSFRLLFRNLWAVLRLVWGTSPRALIGAILLTLPQALASPVLFLVTKSFVNVVATSSGRHAGLRSFLPLVALLTLLTIGQTVTSAIKQHHDEVFGERVRMAADRRFMQTVAHADWAHFENPAWHNRLRRASEQLSFRPHQLSVSLLSAISQSISLIGIAAVLWSIQPLLVAIAVVAALGTTTLHRRATWRWYSFDRDCQEHQRQSWYLRMLVTENQPGKEVRALELAEPLVQRYDRLMTEHFRAKLRIHRLELSLDVLAGVLSGLVLGGGYVFLASLAGHAALSPGSATAALAAFGGFSVAMSSLSRSLLLVEQHATFLDDFFSFLHTDTLVPVPDRPTRLPEGAIGVELDHVSFTYHRADQSALQALSLSIRPGELIALVGDNGAGKTTLVKLLLRLYDPSEGKVRIGGVDLRDADPVEVRSRIGVLFQDFNTFMLSARENIQFGRFQREATDEEIWRTLERAKAAEFIRRRPDGLDTILGPMFSGGTDLSGGELQRVALARLMFRNADIWILDEPTSALDAEAEARIFSQLREYLGNRTGIIISHRISTVRIADRIAVMQHGRITELGTHEELMALGGRYAGLCQLQARTYHDAGQL